MSRETRKKNPHATALAALGAAKGGLARAKHLTPERRIEISRRAAIARWGEPTVPATHDGTLQIGDAEFPCAVLKDGTRVLTEMKFMEGMGMYRSGALSTRREPDPDDRGARVPLYLAFKNLKPFVSAHLSDVHIAPLKYRTLSGNVAHGIRAEIIPKICEVWLDARAAGVLGKAQMKVAAKADMLLRGLANVGIVALVDEATGYQYDRARWALAEILEHYISKDLARWAKTFDDEYYRQIFRLRGWDATDIRKRPAVVGKWTTDIVYARLAPGVLDKLREITPRDDKGRLKHHLHRRLTPDMGVPALREHLASAVTIMKLAPDWKWFMDKLDQLHPKFNTTLLLPFGDEASPRLLPAVGGDNGVEVKAGEIG